MLKRLSQSILILFLLITSFIFYSFTAFAKLYAGEYIEKSETIGSEPEIVYADKFIEQNNTPMGKRRPYAPLFSDAMHSYSNVFRGPLDRFGKIKFPNSILYKYYNDNVEVEDESNIKQHPIND